MAIYSGFSHEKWWFSIAILNYQRVRILLVQCVDASSIKIEPSDYLRVVWRRALSNSCHLDLNFQAMWRMAFRAFGAMWRMKSWRSWETSAACRDMKFGTPATAVTAALQISTSPGTPWGRRLERLPCVHYKDVGQPWSVKMWLAQAIGIVYMYSCRQFWMILGYGHLKETSIWSYLIYIYMIIYIYIYNII